LSSDLSFEWSLSDQPRTNPEMSAQLIYSLDWDQTSSLRLSFGLSPWSQRKINPKSEVTDCDKQAGHYTRGVQKVRSLTQLATRYAHHILCVTFQQSLMQLKCTLSSISPTLWPCCRRIVVCGLLASQATNFLKTPCILTYALQHSNRNVPHKYEA